jgi:uncharacterized membrane protein SpoIIM required for sporulation
VTIDLVRFVETERAYWNELQSMLDRLQADPQARLPLAGIERLHYLYQRCSADLAQLDTFSTEPQLRAFVESLVSRSYSEIHETRARVFRVPWRAMWVAFPRAFRRHVGAFWLALGLTLLGAGFGSFAIWRDAGARAVVMPFPGLMRSPAERVAQEEGARLDLLRGRRASFAAELMTHNTRVAIMALAAGMTWGLGTIILLFYNGVILGAVAADYVAAGQTAFLAGWLLPHGAIEIPAILLGGQAGLVLAGALIGWGERTRRAARLRAVAHDLAVIAAGTAALLVWAGLVEAFVSQYHQPVLPYALKIAFGLLELVALTVYLARAGSA